MPEVQLAPGEVEAPSVDRLNLLLSDTEMTDELREKIAEAIDSNANDERLRVYNILTEIRAGQVPTVLVHQMKTHGNHLPQEEVNTIE